MVDKQDSPETSPTTYTLVAVFKEDDILHKTFQTLKDVNKFVKTELADKGALVFVVKGTLMPESQWREPDEENNKYWIVI